MVEFNPEDSSQLHPESGKTFGGIYMTPEEWRELDLNQDLLEKSIEEIYQSEDPEYYSLNNTKTTYSTAPTQIILIDTGSELLPFYIKPHPVHFIYRGREKFSRITRREGGTVKVKTVESDFEGAEVPETVRQHKEYYLYSQSDSDPVGYIPITSDQNKIIVSGSSYSLDNVYVASDQFLVELLGITDVYLEKTV